jgi:TPR repeat protein
MVSLPASDTGLGLALVLARAAEHGAADRQGVRVTLNQTANRLSCMRDRCRVGVLFAIVAWCSQAAAQDAGAAPDSGCTGACAEPTTAPPSPEQLADEGARYATGQGVARDVERAAGLFRRACDQGSARACNNLGVLYHQESGAIPRDDAQAARLFMAACDAGYMPACYNLGLLYEPAENGKPRAAELFRRACHGGHQPACTKLRQATKIARPGSMESEAPEPCTTRDGQRHDPRCWTPREGIVSGYVVALDLGILSPSPAPKERLSLGLGVTFALRLGMALWDHLVLDIAYGGTLILSDETEGDDAGSFLSGDFFNFEGGYQYRFRPSRSQSITIGLLAGYLHGLGDLSRTLACTDCADPTPTKLNPSGANLSGFTRVTFGRLGRVGIFVRTRWFLTGGLLHDLGAGFEFGLP